MSELITAHKWLAAWEAARYQRPAHRAISLLTELGGWSRERVLEMPVGQRDAELMRLYASQHAQAVDCCCKCPNCGETLEFTLLLEKLIPQADKPSPASGVLIDDGGDEWRWRLPTAGDMIAISDVAQPELAAKLLVERCLAAAPVGGVFKEGPTADLVDQLAGLVRENDPLTLVELRMNCAVCAAEWPEVFDIVTFFWKVVDRISRRLLAEVHVLASRYGWTEEDVFALSAHRRAAYLEMCAG